MTVLAAPDRDPMSPPELAADAPVADVLEPVEVDLLPAVRDEADTPRAGRLDRRLGEGLHPHEPLGRDGRLDDGFAAVAGPHRVGVGLDLLEEPALLQLLDDALAALQSVQTREWTRLRGHSSQLVDYRDRGQARAACPCRSRSGRARASPSPPRSRTPCRRARRAISGISRKHDRQDQPRAAQRLIASVFGMDGHGGVPEHRLGPGGRHHHRAIESLRRGT